jgi:radical SAM protein with 4Fe4S-binding SPASM domain
MAISLDGWDAPSHDSFRGIPGTFDTAMAALRHARQIGLETQLQTTVTKRNMAHLGEIAALADEIQTKMWSLFFLVVTGRALEADDLTAEEYEQVFEQIYQLSKVMPFDIKTTEAMHYRRYAAQRRKQEGTTDQSRAGSAAWRSAGVSDGKGFVFVSHTGDICPSGFLPVVAGNVRVDSLGSIYRDSTLFRSLRDTSMRGGKCGACEFRNLCGGSRARAYATTGDYLAPDPRCSYHPNQALPMVGHVQQGGPIGGRV